MIMISRKTANNLLRSWAQQVMYLRDRNKRDVGGVYVVTMSERKM